MAGIYVYSDKLEVAASLLALGRTLGEPCTALTFRPREAEELMAYGAGTVAVAESPRRPEDHGKALAEWLLEQDADLFLVGNTCRGRELAALVAGYAGCGMVSDADGLTREGDGYCADLTVYGGLVSRRERLSGLTVVTAGRGAALAQRGTAGGNVISLRLKCDDRVRVEGRTPLEKSGVDLGAAAKVVGIGMGCREADVSAAQALARALGGELGCSRNVAEQRKWLPEERYIGISGAIIRPALYLAIGVSGQIQHIFGVRDSKIVAAINNNDSAPIFTYADYGIVGDAHTLIPLLTQAIEKL